MIAFATALDCGAGIECDLRLTADDRIVIFHDADARRLCGSSLQIGQSGLKELAALRVGGEPIPTLENMLEMVAGRVPILLEVKVHCDLRRWLAALEAATRGYAGPFGIMSFDPRIARLVKTKMPHVRRGLVIRDSLPPLRRKLALSLTAPHFIAVDRLALGNDWVERARHRMPVYSWTIRTVEQRAQAAVHADALIWEADGRPRN